MTDQRDCADSAEPTLSHEPIDSSESAEPTEATEAVEPIEPIDNTEPSDAMDSTEPRDHSDNTERSEPTDHFDVEAQSAPPGPVARPRSEAQDPRCREYGTEAVMASSMGDIVPHAADERRSARDGWVQMGRGARGFGRATAPATTEEIRGDRRTPCHVRSGHGDPSRQPL